MKWLALLLLAPCFAYAANVVTCGTPVPYSGVATITATSPATLTNPSILVALLTEDTPGSVPTISDNKNAGNYAQDVGISTGDTVHSGGVYIESKQNTQTAQATITATFTSSHGDLTVCQVVGAPTSSALDATGSASASGSSPVATSVTTTQGGDSIFAIAVTSLPSPSGDSGYTVLFGPTAVFNFFHIGEYNATVGTGSITVNFNEGSTNTDGYIAAAAYKTASQPTLPGPTGGLNFP